MTTNQSIETADIEFVPSWQRDEPEPITREQLLNIHRQMVSAIKEINRAIGRDVKIIVIRQD